MKAYVEKFFRYAKHPVAGVVRLSSKISEMRARARYRYSRERTVLDVYPVVWIRTPKCASSSIRVALESADGLVDWNRDQDIEIENEPMDHKMICVGADNWKRFSAQHREVWDRSFKWAVVRNPYDRVVSAWKYLEGLREKPLVEILRNPPIEDGSPSEYYHLWKPFSEMLVFEDQMIVDRLVKYEDLDIGLRSVFSFVGMPYHGIPRTNVSHAKRKHYSAYLDEECKELIRERFSKDICAFGFAEE